MTILRPTVRGRAAFTLIETIVVLVVIAIIAALLFPVLSAAREQARAISCMVNERQIGLALSLYLQDYDEKYPQEHPTSGDPRVDDSRGQLERADYGTPFQKILPYVGGADGGSPGIYICPSDPDPHGRALLGATGSCIDSGRPPGGPLNSYVINAYFLFGATLSQLDEPLRTIFISERRDDFCDIHYHPWFGEVNAPLTAQDNTDPVAVAIGRHSLGSNYLFADGHTRWARFIDTRTPFGDHELYGEHQAF